MQLVIASRNAGKLRELRQLLSDVPVDLVSAEEAGLAEVDETGTTFEENARLKARAALLETGLPSLGEDSGIEIDALGGEPGVYSSRFAGPDASDEDRNRLVMERLDGIPDTERSCRYRSVIVVAWPDGRESMCDGRCEGRIARVPSGENGFGYDPIFYLPDYDCTMAEISPEEKNRISHRGRALAGVVDVLKEPYFQGFGNRLR